MCALSEDSLAWEILNEYEIDPEKDDLEQTATKIAREKYVTQGDVLAILRRHFNKETRDHD